MVLQRLGRASSQLVVAVHRQGAITADLRVQRGIVGAFLLALAGGAGWAGASLLADGVGHDHLGSLAGGLALLALGVASVGMAAWLLWIVIRGESSSEAIERRRRFWIVIPLAWLSEAGLLWLAATAVRDGRTGLAWSLGGLALIVLLAAITLVASFADYYYDLEELPAAGSIVLAEASLGWLTVAFAGEGQFVLAGLMAGLALTLLLFALWMIAIGWSAAPDRQKSLVIVALIWVPIAGLGGVAVKLAEDGRVGFAFLVGGVVIVPLVGAVAVAVVTIARRYGGASHGLLPIVIALMVIVTVVVAGVFNRRAIQHANSPGQWGGLFAFALLCAVISFAMIEIAKRLLPVRGIVQGAYLQQWWVERARSVGVSQRQSWDELMEAMNLGPNRVKAYPPAGSASDFREERLIGYADQRSARTIFGLPIQQLSAQISGAVDMALTEPARYLELYYLLTRSPSDAVSMRIALRRAMPDIPPDLRGAVEAYLRGYLPLQDLGNRIAGHLLDDDASRALQQLVIPQEPDDPSSFRASQRARTTIDAIQVTVGLRWRRTIQAAAVLVAALAGLLIELAQPSQNRWLLVMVAAVIGGPLAWTIRDVTAVLQNWRR